MEASSDSSTTTQPDRSAPDGKTRARILAASILGGLIVLFAVLNSQTVKVHLIATTLHLPLIVVIVLCGAVGFSIGWLMSRRRATRTAGE